METEHHDNLMSVLKVLEENDIKLNRNKCEFYRDEVTFFGLRFSKDGVAPTQDRFKCLREAPAPVDGKDFRSFFAA